MASSDNGTKIIYLARRAPGIADRDRFVRRWRQHGAFGMSMDYWSNIKRYAHCDIIGEIKGDGQICESKYDGIGELWYRPKPHVSYASDQLARAAMLRDELETFSAPVATARLVTTEHKEVDRSQAVGVKLVRLIDWLTPLSWIDALSVWHEQSRHLVKADDSIVRHVLSVVLEPAADGSALRCDVVDEVGFCTIEALASCVQSVDVTTLEAGGHLLARARAFVTNEVVLYDPDFMQGIGELVLRGRVLPLFLMCLI